MADFTPKPGKETGKARGSLAVDNTEHQEPPHVYLDHHHLEKLGITKMPKVGSKIKVSGLVHVGSTSENSSSPPSGGKAQGKGGEGETRRSMTLHFHKMEMGKEGIEGADEESQKDGMKAEIDKALTKHAGSEAAKGKPKGKTPPPRAGGD